jgi:DNA-binding NarL/FixJ family response regulator
VVREPFAVAFRRTARRETVRGPAKGIIKGAGLSYTVLIVDDNVLIRHALHSSIEQTRDWQVCGEAENGKVAVEKVKQLHPDVVILDLMPFMEGLEAAGQINLFAPNTAMLMFTMHNCEQLLKYAPAASISDVLSKSDGLAEHVLACLKRLHVEHRACA